MLPLNPYYYISYPKSMSCSVTIRFIQMSKRQNEKKIYKNAVNPLNSIDIPADKKV